jgi:hypothetical protein
VNADATTDDVDEQLAKTTSDGSDLQSGVISGRSRIWLLIVCSLGVLLVISSMVALNAMIHWPAAMRFAA